MSDLLTNSEHHYHNSVSNLTENECCAGKSHLRKTDSGTKQTI